MNPPLWFIEAGQLAATGKLPRYIPILADKNRENELSLGIADKDGRIYYLGDENLTFPLMSVVKPLLLFYLLSRFNLEVIRSKVGSRPSDYPFNSPEQLRLDKGFPRNPMINSGALVLTDMLPGESPASRCENLRRWLNDNSGSELFLDVNVLNSVKSLPNLKNQALVAELTLNNRLNNPETVLETYNHICCLAGTIIDLVRLGLLLNSTRDESANFVREIMRTCGLYEASQNFILSSDIGTKSGVSGVILSIVPTKCVIASYSPPLDAQGNSVAGLYLLTKLMGNDFEDTISQLKLYSDETF